MYLSVLNKLVYLILVITQCGMHAYHPHFIDKLTEGRRGSIIGQVILQVNVRAGIQTQDILLWTPLCQLLCYTLLFLSGFLMLISQS